MRVNCRKRSRMPTDFRSLLIWLRSPSELGKKIREVSGFQTVSRLTSPFLLIESSSGQELVSDPTNRFGGPECQSLRNKCKILLMRYYWAASGFPMKVSGADQVTKIEGENRALIAAKGPLRP